MSPRLVTIVTPCYNEALAVEPFWSALVETIDACLEWTFEVLFVDDGSKDATLERLSALAKSDERIRVLSLSRNFGHQVALSAGLDRARGEAVIFMDSDLQHPPELIPEMLARLLRGYDVVSAVRIATDDASFWKRWSSSGFYTVFNSLSDTKIPEGAADFVCLSKRAYRQLRRMREQHRLLRAMISWMGFARDTIAYQAPVRVAGASKYTLRKMLRLAFDGVFAFSAQPIRYGIRAGLGIAALGLGYLVYVIVMSQFYGATTRGWASIIATLLILGGFQICMIGLIGEYIARTFDQSKRRPLYVLKSDSWSARKRLATALPATKAWSRRR